MISRTTTALLEGLRDPEDEATWREFDGRYRPILVAFARRFGLSTEDAADVAQESLTRFVESYRDGKYERHRGRLHSWVIGIAKRCVVDVRRQRTSRRERRGLSAIVDLSDDNQLAKVWEAECRNAILAEGMRELRSDTKIAPRTLGAFELLTLEKQSPSEVADALQMTMNEVYLAKHRCIKRLRIILTSLNEAYEMTGVGLQ